MEEVYKEYLGKYLISNFGNIKNLDGSPRDFSPSKGWARIGRDNVGRVVYKLFKGDIKKNYHIRHIDGDALNNHVGNLSAEKRLPDTRPRKQRVSFFDFLRDARLAHGDRYEYKEESFISIGNKITVVCKKHGEFRQGARDHTAGHGCWKCHSEKSKTWSEQEDQYLKENYSILGPNSCALNLKKTRSACASRAVSLGITKKASYREAHPNVPNHIWRGLLSRLNKIERGKRAELDFTVDFVWELFQRQNGKCALTGFDLAMGENAAKNTVSIDRINSQEGYLKNNTQLVHKDVNRIKNYYGEKYFYQICKAVTNYRGDLQKFETEWEWNECLDTETPMAKLVKITNPLE